jgi:hypothetical protein
MTNLEEKQSKQLQKDYSLSAGMSDSILERHNTIHPAEGNEKASRCPSNCEPCFCSSWEDIGISYRIEFGSQVETELMRGRFGLGHFC